MDPGQLLSEQPGDESAALLCLSSRPLAGT